MDKQNYLNVIRDELSAMKSLLSITEDHLFDYARFDYPEEDLRTMVKIMLSTGKKLRRAMGEIELINQKSL